MIANSEKFIIFDDVNYINRGFVNKNFIYTGKQKQRITLYLREASQNKQINEVKVFAKENIKTLKTIKYSFSKAPNFSEVYL